MPDFLQKESCFNQKILDAQGCLNKLTDEEKVLLVNTKHDIEFQPGESIVKRGMLVNNVLYLTEGLAKLELENDNKSATVALINSHSFIGIVCCFAFEQFDFNATALEKTKVSQSSADCRPTVPQCIKAMRGLWTWDELERRAGISKKCLQRLLRFPQTKVHPATQSGVDAAFDEFKIENSKLKIKPEAGA